MPSCWLIYQKYIRYQRPWTISWEAGNIHRSQFSSSQSKHATSQRNCRKQTHGGHRCTETTISMLIFNIFSFIWIIYMENDFDSKYHCVPIEYNVLHQFESYLERLSWIDILCSLHKRGWLKIVFVIVISTLCFRRRPQQVILRLWHCDVEYFDCTL